MLSQYQNLLNTILEHGERTNTQQETDAITYMAPPPLRFKLSEGFPMITERSIRSFWKGAVAEIIAFINGARTQDELEKFGCKWWHPWVTKAKTKKRGLETGDLGPGSYGGAFHDFPTAEGESFNQFAAVIQQIKERPHLRTHFISPWIPQYQYRIEGRTQKVVVCPCHGWIHLRILNGKLTLHMFQRSADVPVGVPANMVQYAALLMMIAHVTGYEPYEYIHSFSDAHIYVDQVPRVKELIAREARPLPTVKLINTHDNLFDFRKDDFELFDYHPHPAMKDIPVAI
jgi:thymidylate synthase